MLALENRVNLERTCKTNLWAGKIDQLTSTQRNLDHQCWEENNRCNPENETQLIGRGRLQPNQYTGIDYIYLCDRGIMHVCSSDECFAWMYSGSCPISGMVHGKMFDTGKDRSGHYMKNTKSVSYNHLAHSTHSIVREGYYGNGSRRKRLLNESAPAILVKGEKEQDSPNTNTKRVKLLSLGNIFRKNGSSTIVVERTEKRMKHDKITSLHKEKKNSHITQLSRSSSTSSRLSSVKIEPSFVIKKEKGTEHDEIQPSSTGLISTIKNPERKKGCRREITDAMKRRFKKNVETIIASLFFSRIRSTLNQKAKDEAEREWVKKYKQYRKNVETQGREQTYIEKYEIALNTQVETPFAILENKGTLVSKYYKVVRHVWNVVSKYGTNSFCNAGPRVCIQLTLGCLYSMRNSGIVVDNINYLPQNPQLLDLPSLPLLHHFKQAGTSNTSYNRSFTTGANAILQSYQNAVNQGVPISDLILDTNTATPETMCIKGKKVEQKFKKVISRPAKALALKWIDLFVYLEEEDVYNQIILDKPHVKPGNKSSCLEKLGERNNAMKKAMDNVTLRLQLQFKTLPKEDVVFVVVMNKVWRDRSQYAKCIAELKIKEKKYLANNDDYP